MDFPTTYLLQTYHLPSASCSENQICAVAIEGSWEPFLGFIGFGLASLCPPGDSFDCRKEVTVNKARRVMLLLALSAVVLLLAGCSKKEAAEAEAPAPVQVTAVTQDTIRRTVAGDGILWPRNQASVMPKISAPRRMVCLAIAFGATPFSRKRSVTRAKETPERKMKSGAGSVPPSCDQTIKEEDFLAAALSHES